MIPGKEAKRGCKLWPMGNKHCVDESHNQWNTQVFARTNQNQPMRVGRMGVLRLEFWLKSVLTGSSTSRKFLRVRELSLSLRLLSSSTPASPSMNKNIGLHFYIYVFVVVCQDPPIEYYNILALIFDKDIKCGISWSTLVIWKAWNAAINLVYSNSVLWNDESDWWT